VGLDWNLRDWTWTCLDLEREPVRGPNRPFFLAPTMRSLLLGPSTIISLSQADVAVLQDCSALHVVASFCGFAVVQLAALSQAKKAGSPLCRAKGPKRIVLFSFSKQQKSISPIFRRPTNPQPMITQALRGNRENGVLKVPATVDLPIHTIFHDCRSASGVVGQSSPKSHHLNPTSIVTYHPMHPT
jgi:hypothetical protein